jgi:hypothetical protein
VSAPCRQHEQPQQPPARAASSPHPPDARRAPPRPQGRRPANAHP